MIRMQRSKPRTSGTGIRTRCVTMRFTADRNASGLFIKPNEVVNCDCSEGVLQTLPEWEYLIDSEGNQINCNFADLLEVGSVKVNRGSQSYEDEYYLITKAGSFLYYKPREKGFYNLAVNRVKVVPFFVQTKEGGRLALCTRKGFLLASLDGGYVTPINVGTLSAGALFKHRIFVAMREGIVKYSAPEDFTNFDESVDEGGSIEFPNCGGEIVAMKAYDDALYIFFRSGIVRLKAGGEPARFYAEQLDYTGGDIFSRTVCKCEHAIYFLARNGLHRLSGKRVERLDLDVYFPTEETGLEGCSVWKDRPMIQYQRLDGKMTTIVVSRDGKSYFFMDDLNLLGRGEDGRVLFTDKSKYLCQLTDKGTHWYDSRFDAHETDFGWTGKKQLKCIRVYGEGHATISILGDGVSRTESLEFYQGVAEIKFNRAGYGERFHMSFVLDRATKVTSVQVEYNIFA